MFVTKLKPMAEHKPLSRFYRIGPQFWSDGPLNRHPLAILHNEKADAKESVAALRRAVEEESGAKGIMLFHRGQIGVVPSTLQLAWQPWKKVGSMGLHFRELELDHENNNSAESTLLLLGRVNHGEFAGELRFAVDLTSLPDITDKLDDVKFVEARSLMGVLPRNDLAMVGQCVSRLNWHNEMKFHPTTGTRSVAAGGGHRRRDETTGQSLYPRTDPVAIMLVQSRDGERCLLGKTARRHTSNMYSCLAGFVEQCESVEEACRREVFEEAGVVVSEVQVVGTQPWPIGAAGHCELMIGCVARAENDEINFDAVEMADVRWFSRKEALEMLERSAKAGAMMGSIKDPLVVPPDFAIAHSLIKAWATNDTWKGTGNSPTTSNFPFGSVSMVHSTCLLGAGVFIGAALARSLL